MKKKIRVFRPGQVGKGKKIRYIKSKSDASERVEIADVMEMCASISDIAKYRYLYAYEFTVPTGRRLDFLALPLSDSRPIIASEIKMSRHDFLNDQKWPEYVPYCNLFFFACPRGIIRIGDLPTGVGLIWVYGPRRGKVIVRPELRKMEVGYERDVNRRMLKLLINGKAIPSKSDMIVDGMNLEGMLSDNMDDGDE